MAATVHYFRDFSALNPKPAHLYCDSNFLIRLLFYSDNFANPSVLSPRDIACYDFYKETQQHGVALVTSAYGYSELLHFYFFLYEYGLYSVTKDFFRTMGITPPAKSIHEQFKYFIKNYYSDFLAAFQRISHRVERVETFLDQIGITVRYPLPSPHLTNISKNIIDFASVLVEAFPGLESNDAMHLSIADYLGINEVVSLDDSFKNIDTFIIFAFN